MRPARELPKRDNAALNVPFVQAPPRRRRRVVHFAPASEPLAFLSSKLANKGIGIDDEAEEQREVAPLTLRDIINVHRASFEKNRS